MAKVLPQRNAGAQFLAIINSYPLLKNDGYFDVKPSHTVTFSNVCFWGIVDLSYLLYQSKSRTLPLVALIAPRSAFFLSRLLTAP